MSHAYIKYVRQRGVKLRMLVSSLSKKISAYLSISLLSASLATCVRGTCVCFYFVSFIGLLLTKIIHVYCKNVTWHRKA